MKIVFICISKLTRTMVVDMYSYNRQMCQILLCYEFVKTINCYVYLNVKRDA